VSRDGPQNGPKLLLIRHGQIRANAQSRWHGSTDSPLTRSGRRQAAHIARHLSRTPAIDAVYSSPLKRCRVTAVAIAAAVGRSIVVDDDLREYGVGQWEDLPYRQLADEHDFFKRIGSDPDYAPLGGDSVNAVARRIVPALARIHALHRGASTVAVVGHGAALAIALAALLDGDPGRWTHYPLANCSITELVLSPEPLIAAFNRTEHL